MQNSKKLTVVLKELVALLEEEAAQNPAFSQKLDGILAGLSSPGKKTRASTARPSSIPDVFAELTSRGDDEFRFWLRTLDVATLKAIVKLNGFDPAKAAQRWTDKDKFVSLVAEQTISRMKRGAAFLPGKSDLSSEHETKPEHQ